LDGGVEGRDVECFKEDLSSDFAIATRVERWFGEEQRVLGR